MFFVITDTASRLLTIKGAPDVLISRCADYVSEHSETMPLNAAMRSRLEELKDLYSSQGKRCLLLARKVIKAGNVPNDTESQAYEKAITDESKSGLVLVGFVAIVDPLRDDIPHVVSTLRGAGIRIAMVSDVQLCSHKFDDDAYHNRLLATLLLLLWPLLEMPVSSRHVSWTTARRYTDLLQQILSRVLSQVMARMMTIFTLVQLF